MPEISVIMSTYNCGKYIRQAIDSILNQSFRDIEFLIIDDASNDNTLDIINKIAGVDNRIRVFVNPVNLGLTKNLNRLITLAQGKYIARMDADDIAIPTRLETQKSVLDNNPSYDLVFSDTLLIQENGTFICPSWRPTKLKNILKALEYRNYIPHPTVMVRKNVFKENLYNEIFKTAQDYELWKRLYRKGYKFYYVKQILLEQRIRISSSRNIKGGTLGQSHFFTNEYFEYANICIWNRHKRNAMKYLKKLNILEKLIILIKLFIPFKLMLLKRYIYCCIVKKYS